MRRTWMPWLVIFVLASAGALVIVLVIKTLHGGRGGEPAEMGQSDLAELVTDLHKKPDVRSVVATHYREAPRPGDYLPPDRRYEYTLLHVEMEAPAGGISFWAYNCSSGDRAELLLKRLPKVWDAPGYRSGRWAIYCGEPAAQWLRKYYHLSPAP